MLAFRLTAFLRYSAPPLTTPWVQTAIVDTFAFALFAVAVGSMRLDSGRYRTGSLDEAILVGISGATVGIVITIAQGLSSESRSLGLSVPLAALALALASPTSWTAAPFRPTCPSLRTT